MTTRGTFVVIAIGLLLVVSALFYARSSADFDRHANAIAGLAHVRELDERASELVLAARFGLLNQYDSINVTEDGLDEATRDMRAKLAAVVPLDARLSEALRGMETAVGLHRERVERFKAENSVLKNSLHYLPTAAEETMSTLRQLPSPAQEATSLAIQRLVLAVLVYDLIGDSSTRDAYLAALHELESQKQALPSLARSKVSTLLAHATVIGQKKESVDATVREIFDSGDRARIATLEASYQQSFAATVVSANRYRKILYLWSLVLLAVASVAALGLRKLYADLERLVAERTRELRGALDALWGEMRLAKKIQEALLPASPELTNYEIAASMRATDEVGGDYYDVIRTRDADWVLIGDVSGHGVPAGLIMMMCHTAVRAVLRTDPGIKPDRLLVAVNSVLSESIRQLGETKYMTITAFRCDRDGSVLFSGAHQDIQIFRASTNEVETIQTSGIWLGLKSEIGESMSTSRFRLASGDVLLLHTDGITEAIRDGRMFDTAGVRRVLGQARHKTADEVVKDVCAALAGYVMSDDATLLAIRQLTPDEQVNHEPLEDYARRAS